MIQITCNDVIEEVDGIQDGAEIANVFSIMQYFSRRFSWMTETGVKKKGEDLAKEKSYVIGLLTMIVWSLCYHR